MSKKEINCRFFVMTDTGEKPDAEVHMVGFDQEDGMFVNGQLNGGGRDIAQLVANGVGTLIEKLKKEQGIVAVAAFIDMVETKIAETAGKEAILLAGLMSDPETMAGAITKLVDRLDEDELEELLGGDE